MFGIYAPSTYTDFLPLFLSISVCLQSNGYSVYFIAPNKIQKYQLNKNHLDYCDKSEETLKKLGIQKILFWNGIQHNLKIPGITNYYFENGYFGNDLQIFNDGVNAQSEITSLSYKDFLEYKNTSSSQVLQNSKVIHTLDFTLYNYWFLGFFSQSPLKSFTNFSKIFRNIIEEKKRKNILKHINTPKIEKGKYVLIGFQVHDDTQILYNSPIVRKMEDILEYFYTDIKSILPDYTIVIKEHPMDVGRVDYSCLQKKYPNIIWIQKGDISEYIDLSEYLICVNSSIGLQALARYKKVLTLGENFYSKNPWVQNIQKRGEFSQKLKDLKNSDPKKHITEIDEYIQHFKTQIFISEGGWQNFHTGTIESILQHLIKK